MSAVESVNRLPFLDIFSSRDYKVRSAEGPHGRENIRTNTVLSQSRVRSRAKRTMERGSTDVLNEGLFRPNTDGYHD